MPLFEVGDEVEQTGAYLFFHENPICVITKIEGDIIWHKHKGRDYSHGSMDSQTYGSSVAGFGNFRLIKRKSNVIPVYGISIFMEKLNKNE